MLFDAFDKENLSVLDAELSITAYRYAGSADLPMVVFLPGLFAGGWMWAHAFAHARLLGHECIVFREALAKISPGSRLPLQVLHRALEPWLPHHRHVVICGNSIGGLLALEISQSLGVAARVLASGVPGLSRASLPDLPIHRSPDAADARRVAAGIFHPSFEATKEMLEDALSCFTDRRFLKNIMGYMLAARRYPVVSRVTSCLGRLHLVWGREDRITPFEPWRATFEHEFDHGLVSLTLLDECGHSPMLEKPTAFVRVLDEVLACSPVEVS